MVIIHSNPNTLSCTCCTIWWKTEKLSIGFNITFFKKNQYLYR